MHIHINQPRRHSRPAKSRRRRRGHDVLIVLLLGVLAVVAALAWLAEHLAVLAGAALLVWGAYYLGHLHERRRARPGQARPPRGWAEEPAATAVVPAVTRPQADYDWDEEPATRQPASLQADRDSLLNTPMSGVRPLRGPS